MDLNNLVNKYKNSKEVNFGKISDTITFYNKAKTSRITVVNAKKCLENIEESTITLRKQAYKSENQNETLPIINRLFNSRKYVIQLFGDYTAIAPEATIIQKIFETISGFHVK